MVFFGANYTQCRVLGTVLLSRTKEPTEVLHMLVKAFSFFTAIKYLQAALWCKYSQNKADFQKSCASSLDFKEKKYFLTKGCSLFFCIHMSVAAEHLVGSVNWK